jgi:hypothetical protein
MRAPQEIIVTTIMPMNSVIRSDRSASRNAPRHPSPTLSLATSSSRNPTSIFACSTNCLSLCR